MNEVTQHLGGVALLEKVILGNDLGSLSPLEKVQHVSNICQSLGLNPLTKPIQLLKFQGREIPYVTRDGCDQLRKINNISIPRLETKVIEGGAYIVTAYAQTPDNRQDSSTGVISIKGLTGDALCNAMMKAETKAKRRVTLSICGLGLTEESELDTMKGHEKVDHKALEDAHSKDTGEISEPTPTDNHALMDYIAMMDGAKDQDLLKELFTKSYKKFKNNSPFIEKIMEAKDRNKARLDMESEIGSETIANDDAVEQ